MVPKICVLCKEGCEEDGQTYMYLFNSYGARWVVHNLCFEEATKAEEDG